MAKVTLPANVTPVYGAPLPWSLTSKITFSEPVLFYFIVIDDDSHHTRLTLSCCVATKSMGCYYGPITVDFHSHS